jgi:hypothetical protein
LKIQRLLKIKIITLTLFTLLTACGGDSDKSISGKDIGGGQPPPYHGSIFVDPDIIKDSDPTSFVSLTYIGQETRFMFDRRGSKSKKYNAHLYIAAFDDGVEMEIQVNPEFSQASALKLAEIYSRPLGQMPFTLRKHIKYVFIHDGNYDFSGNLNSSEGIYDASGDGSFSDGWVLIHTLRGDEYIADNILAETLVHEAVHATFERDHAGSAKWLQAQQQDIGFITTYAQQYHTTEDLAESFLFYLAVRYKPDRISDELNQTISTTIKHRINYFDTLNIEIYPMVMSSQ